MSTLNVTNVQSDTYKNKSGTREYGKCTAWVNFNGTGTVAIRDALNVSSITDNGVGDYTLNFSQSMTSANFSLAFTVGTTVADAYSLSHDALTVSGVRVVAKGTNTVNYDANYCSVQIFGGDL